MFAIWDSIKTFVKGMIMGAANVFPISSGTVSLVLGVFERFINAINSLRIKNRCPFIKRLCTNGKNRNRL